MNLFVLFGRPTSMMDAVRPPFAIAGEQQIDKTGGDQAHDTKTNQADFCQEGDERRNIAVGYGGCEQDRDHDVLRVMDSVDGWNGRQGADQIDAGGLVH